MICGISLTHSLFTNNKAILFVEQASDSDRFPHLADTVATVFLLTTGMTVCTLKAKYEPSNNSVGCTCVIYCHAKNPKEIYYQFEDKSTPEPASISTLMVVSPAPTVEPAPVAASPSITTPPAGRAAAIADEPLKAIDLCYHCTEIQEKGQ